VIAASIAPRVWWDTPEIIACNLLNQRQVKRKNAQPLTKHLTGCASDGRKEWRSDFKKNLKLSDAVVLHWGSASEKWLRATLQDCIPEAVGPLIQRLQL